MCCLRRFDTPQLELVSRGKVRDSFRINEETRLIVATDRLSAFDRVLDTCIPGKGATLNHLAAHWFEQTRHIVPNHYLKMVADQAMLVREAQPIPLEIIVRAYITGSAWRAYARGRRSVSGVSLPEGLTRNARLPEPIVTPTTKSKHDEEIDPAGVAAAGIVDHETYQAMERISLELFAHASRTLAEQGILLVDSKYEFGWIDGEVVVIDEIHTPDSSRFWRASDYEAHPESAEALDKEFVRGWLLAEKEKGNDPTLLPDVVVEETSRRYRGIGHEITGKPLPPVAEDAPGRLVEQLAGAGVLRDGFVTIVCGSFSDAAHAERIAGELAPYGLYVSQRIASAHKTPARVEALCIELNAACEPGVVIAVAGLSNGLGGALAANLTLPVINCPPFADRLDVEMHLGSSVHMPSNVPAMTVLSPNNAAQAALRCLQRPRLRTALQGEIATRWAAIAEADRAAGVHP